MYRAKISSNSSLLKFSIATFPLLVNFMLIFIINIPFSVKPFLVVSLWIKMNRWLQERATLFIFEIIYETHIIYKHPLSVVL